MYRTKRFTDKDLRPFLGRVVALREGAKRPRGTGRLSLVARAGHVFYEACGVQFDVDAVLQVVPSQVLPILLVTT